MEKEMDHRSWDYIREESSCRRPNYYTYGKYLGIVAREFGKDETYYSHIIHFPQGSNFEYEGNLIKAGYAGASHIESFLDIEVGCPLETLPEVKEVLQVAYNASPGKIWVDFPEDLEEERRNTLERRLSLRKCS